jgi:hypothetical protein
MTTPFKVLLTTVEREDDVFMDVEEFTCVPRVGEFVTLGREAGQIYRIVQVVHCLGQYGYDFGVTVEPSQLSHPVILDPGLARDS